MDYASNSEIDSSIILIFKMEKNGFACLMRSKRKFLNLYIIVNIIEDFIGPITGLLDLYT